MGRADRRHQYHDAQQEKVEREKRRATMNIFIVLMVIYIVAMLILGYLGSKRATDSTSYATSNGDVSVFNVSITFAATFASAGTFLGVAGQGFAYGLTNFWFWASQWTSAGIIMAIIVRRYR